MSEREILETINVSRSNQYTLSIRLSTDGFSFSIFNPVLEDRSISYFQQEIDPSLSFIANLKQVFRENEFLSYPYKLVKVMIVNNRSTLIPFELFDDEQNESIFYYNHAKRENEQILYNILKKSNLVVLFGINIPIFNFIKEQYPAVRFYSQLSPFIELFSVKSRFGDTKKMYAYLKNDSLDVFCYERGRMLLTNSFACQTKEDRIYYLLNTWKQLLLNQEKDELYLTGNTEGRDELLKELNRFILEVSVIDPTEEFENISVEGEGGIPFDMQVFSLNNI